MKEVSRRSVLRGLTAGAALGVAAPWMAQAEAYNLGVVKKDLVLERWDAPGFRLGFISDLHMNGEKQTDRALRALSMVMEERPDILVIGGDWVEHSQMRYIKFIERFLKHCADVSCPIAGVLGNHDYWGDAVDDLSELISKSNVKLLRNELFESQGVTIAGADDGCVLKDRYDYFEKGRVSRSLIGIVHEPDLVRKQPAHVSLQVSGHSHGGQVCLPGGAHLHTPKYAKKYIAGYYEREVPLYVSKGVGTAGPDFRLFCQPEVTVLTLRSA